MKWYSLIKTAAPALYSISHLPKSNKVNLEIAKRFYRFMQQYEAAPFVEKNTPSWGGTDKNKFPVGYDLHMQSKQSEEEKQKLKETYLKIRTFYHGTGSAAWSKIHDYGMMKSPESALANQAEQHPSSRQVLYFSQNKGTGESYSEGSGRSGILDNQRVVIVLKIPLYAFAEVRNGIFRPYIQGKTGSSNYHPNEQHGHYKISNVVQPMFKQLETDLNNIKSRKERIKKEKETFVKILKAIDNVFENNHGEWTITHAVPLRYMVNLHLPNPVLGCKLLSELTAKLNSSPQARKEFLDDLKNRPTLFSLLSPEQEGYKTARQVASKAWLQKLEENHDNIKWIPSSMMDPKVSSDFIFPTNKGEKHSLYSYANQVIIPSLISKGEKAEKSTEYFTFQTWLLDVPKILQSNPAIKEIIKNGMIKFGKQYPDEVGKLCGCLTKGVWDQQFLDAMIENVWSKCKVSTLDHMWRAQYDSAYDEDFPLPNSIALHPKAMMLYFSKVNPFKVKYFKFPDDSLMKIADFLKQRIIDAIPEQSQETIVNYLFRENIEHGSMPHWMIPENAKELVIKKSVSGLKSLMSNYSPNDYSYPFGNFITEHAETLPDYVKQSKEMQEIIKQYITASTYSADIWEMLEKSFPQVAFLPELNEKRNDAKLLGSNLNNIDYTSLTDSQKLAYKTRAIANITQDPRQYASIHPSLSKDTDIINALGKGWIRRVNDHNDNPPEAVMNMPEFKQFLPKIVEYQIKNNVTAVQYSYLVEFYPEMISTFIAKWASNLAVQPTLFDKIPEEIKNNASILTGLATGCKYRIKDYHHFHIADNFWDLPGFEKHHNTIHQSLIEASTSEGIRKVKYSELSPENKDLFLKTIVKRLPTDTSYWEILSNNDTAHLKFEDTVISAAIKGYVYDIIWHNKVSLPTELTQHEKFKAQHKSINDSLIDEGQFRGIFVDALGEEERKKYKYLIINEIKVTPAIYETLDESIKIETDIITATAEGIKNNIVSGYWDQDMINNVLNNPLFQPYEAEFRKSLTERWVSALKRSNTIPVMRKMPASLFEDEEVINVIIERFKAGAFGFYAYYESEKKDELEKVISNKNIKPEFAEKLYAAYAYSQVVISAKNFMNYPEDFKHISIEDKNKYKPILLAEYGKLIAQTTDIPYICNYFTNAYQMFGDDPDMAELKNMAIDKLKKRLSQMDINNAKEWRTYIKTNYVKRNPHLTEITIQKPEDLLQEITNTLAIAKNNTSNTTGYLTIASNLWVEGIKLYPNNPVMEKAKEMIVNAYIEKISTSVSLQSKKNWCILANTYFPGHPQLQQICNVSAQPTKPTPTPKPATPQQNIVNPAPQGPQISNAPKGFKPSLTNFKAKKKLFDLSEKD